MSGEIDQGGDGQCSSSEPVGSGDAGIDTGSKLRFSENVDELIAYLKSHPMFIDHTPTVEEIENNTLLQGIQAMKFDQDDPFSYSTQLKEEGNRFFKDKNYRKAIVSYSEAIKQLESLPNSSNVEISELLAVLFTNRAASQYYLGNRRCSIGDATSALKWQKTHLKAILRLCHCFHDLQYFEDSIKTCDVGLTIVSSENANMFEKLTKLRAESNKALKVKRRNERKEQLKEQTKNDVLNAIRRRGVEVRASWPNESNAAVPIWNLKEDYLMWPVTFFYPTYLECDFIEKYDERTTFYGHLAAMFETPPPWDVDSNHRSSNLTVYYENLEETPRKVVRVKDLGMTLKDCLRQQSTVEEFQLQFFIVPSLTKLMENFESNFLQYKLKFKEKFYSL